MVTYIAAATKTTYELKEVVDEAISLIPAQERERRLQTGIDRGGMEFINMDYNMAMAMGMGMTDRRGMHFHRGGMGSSR